MIITAAGPTQTRPPPHSPRSPLQNCRHRRWSLVNNWGLEDKQQATLIPCIPHVSSFSSSEYNNVELHNPLRWWCDCKCCWSLDFSSDILQYLSFQAACFSDVWTFMIFSLTVSRPTNDLLYRQFWILGLLKIVSWTSFFCTWINTPRWRLVPGKCVQCVTTDYTFSASANNPHRCPGIRHCPAGLLLLELIYIVLFAQWLGRRWRPHWCLKIHFLTLRIISYLEVGKYRHRLDCCLLGLLPIIDTNSIWGQSS